MTFLNNIFKSAIIIFVGSCIDKYFVNNLLTEIVTIHRTAGFLTVVTRFSGR